ncbi:hypothetical protein [Sphingomonas immobilis]|uniref:Uncharacterized protein n=1 Tax=Sphingomonas immobilis TaxID=3063997 RepID=A0ABT9A5E0_9SPHN|nr:hypothetical protein [Sphingomonas sp. CA1-15]MDO7844430.1 hypothetical protein [Sphingomonas sp. CA1-15]
MSFMSAIQMPTIALDHFVQWEPSHRSQAAFSAGLDDATQTVRVRGGGIWYGPDAELYFIQQRRIVEEARRRYGVLKAFYDVRCWVVENPDSVLQFTAMNSEIYRPEDRLVAVVESSVAKPHPRAALAVGQRESFLSLSAAETWLQAYAANGGAPA